MNNIIIQERDICILQMITKYRFLLSRQIRTLATFSGQRACDRRLRKLIDAGYITRKKIIYGLPSLYFCTDRAMRAFNLKYITKNVRIEQLTHEINVVDTAIYLVNAKNIPQKNIITSREIKNKNGFGNPVHTPDLIFSYDEKSACVEIELNEKIFTKLENNVKNNFINYDKQIWIVPKEKTKIVQNLEKLKKQYFNLEIFELEKVTDYVKKI